VGQINYDSGSFPPYDVNGDLSEESLHSVGNLDSLCTGSNCWCTSADPDCHNSAYSVTVLDSTAGDVNPSKSYRDFPGEPLKAPGLRADLRIYGRTTCVATTGPNATTCQNEDEYTYLDVKEGRAYSKNGKAISISEAKKNQYDVIERIYQLNSNITDIEGFKQNNNKSIETECDDPLAVPQPMDPLLSCCMTGGRVETTCLDKTTKTLFIRSRISDKRGHRWTTDTSKTWNQSLGGK
jgi:hypothetical protein